jgi:hypothetical protein
MKEMNWNQLRDAIDRLSPEQREMEIQAWGESIPLTSVTLTTADEDMYFDHEYADEGCFGKSEIPEQEFNEMDGRISIVCKKGLPYLWIGI